MTQNKKIRQKHLISRTADAWILRSQLYIGTAKMFVCTMPQVKENTP